MALTFTNMNSASLNGILSWGAFGYDSTGKNQFATYNAWSTQSSGSDWTVLFKGQDATLLNNYAQVDYTWNTGTVDIVFDSNFHNIHGSTNFSYAHDWSSTDLTGFSFSGGALTFYFNSTSNQWQTTGLYSGY